MSAYLITEFIARRDWNARDVFAAQARRCQARPNITSGFE
jgi:hypothetical protein